MATGMASLADARGRSGSAGELCVQLKNLRNEQDRREVCLLDGFLSSEIVH